MGSLEKTGFNNRVEGLNFEEISFNDSVEMVKQSSPSVLYQTFNPVREEDEKIRITDLAKSIMVFNDQIEFIKSRTDLQDLIHGGFISGPVDES